MDRVIGWIGLLATGLTPAVGSPLGLPAGGAATAEEVVVHRRGLTRTRLVLADGSEVAGGQIVPVEPPCAPSSAVLSRLDVEGLTVWELVAQAVPPDGAAPLFTGSGEIDPALVAWSSVFALEDAGDGTLYAAGEATVAWRPSPGAAVEHQRGAFVVRLTDDGVPLTDRWLGGPIPTGPVDPPPECWSPCDGDDTPADADAFSVAARAITTGTGGRVLLTGWWRQASGGSGDRDVFLAELSADLGQLPWLRLFPSPGDDEGLVVAEDVDGRIFLGGYAGVEHDAFLSKHTPAGRLLTGSLGGGVCYDEGQEIGIAGTSVFLEGFFVEEATFDDQTLEGEGRAAFVVEYDKSTLAVLSAESLEHTGVVIGGVQPPSPSQAPERGPLGDHRPAKSARQLPGDAPRTPEMLGDHQPVLSGVEVVVGKLGVGDPGDLLVVGDEKELVVQGVQLSPDDTFLTAVVRFTFAVHPEAPLLTQVALVAASEHCSVARFGLGGGDVGSVGGTFIPAGDAVMTAGEVSIVEVPVSADANAALGFGGNPASYDLLVDVTFEFSSFCLKPEIACSSEPAEDGSMDQITVTSDYSS